jgi:thioredoxin
VILKRFNSNIILNFAAVNLKQTIQMKKIGYLSVLIIFLFISCNGTTGGEKGKSSTISSANITDGVSKKSESANGKPEHLTEKTFKQKVMDYEKNTQQWVFEGDKPAIVDFYADWCRPCRMIAPILEELAVEYEGKINIYKVDTEAQRELAAVFGITSLPTVLFIPLQGNPSSQKGALPKESYKKIIDEFLLKTPSAISD